MQYLLNGTLLCASVTCTSKGRYLFQSVRAGRFNSQTAGKERRLTVSWRFTLPGCDGPISPRCHPRLPYHTPGRQSHAQPRRHRLKIPTRPPPSMGYDRQTAITTRDRVKYKFRSPLQRHHTRLRESGRPLWPTFDRYHRVP